MESTFDKDLAESEALFKDQFNPDSINFHHGNVNPVPIGGQRVPLSMPTVYEPETTTSNEKPLNYGPDYDHLMQTREFFNGLKKTLSKLTPPIEAILRHKETFAAGGKQSNPAHISKLKKSIDAEKEKIAAVLKELIDLAEVIKNFAEYKESYYSTLNKLIENGTVDYQDKEQFMGYAFEVKNYSKDVFKEMGILLEKIKVIKKEKDTKVVKNENINNDVIEKKQEETKKE